MNESLDLVFWFLFGVLCLFVFCRSFLSVLWLFFLNGVYLQIPEKKQSGGIQVIEEQWKFCCT